MKIHWNEPLSHGVSVSVKKEKAFEYTDPSVDSPSKPETNQDLFFPCFAVIFLKASIPPAPIGLEEGSKPLLGSKLLLGAMV
jgi:hypothetical protein